MTRAAVFVDRDGVLNHLVPDPRTGLPESPLDKDDVRLVEGAAEALGRLRAAGYLIVGVTNQPAAAKGLVPLDQLEAVQERVVELLAREGAAFDRFCLCLHHPDGVVPALTRTCNCRKPAPGMLTDAARHLDIDLGRSWMVGDTDADVAAGAAAGVRTILIEHPASVHRRSKRKLADATAPDLTAAAGQIVDQDSR